MITTPAGDYKCKLFNGYAQVIVQSTGSGGAVELRSGSKGLVSAKVGLQAAG